MGRLGHFSLRNENDLRRIYSRKSNEQNFPRGESVVTRPAAELTKETFGPARR
jgi:hypothetical protein